MFNRSWGPFLLALVVVASRPSPALDAADQHPPAPKWPGQVPVWGVLSETVPSRPSDLEKRALRERELVSTDKRDNIYILEPHSFVVEQYTPGGEISDSFPLPIPAEPPELVTAFGVSPAGDRFAVIDGQKVYVFSRDKQESSFRLPFLAMDVLFDGSDLVIGKIPAMWVMSDGQLKQAFDPVLVGRFSEKGDLDRSLVATEPRRGAGPARAALTLDVRIAAGDQHSVWVADRCAYRVREVDSHGRGLLDYTDPMVKSEVSFTLDEETKKTLESDSKGLTPEARKGFAPIHAPIVLRGIRFHRGLVHVLVDPGMLAETPMVDVFNGSPDGSPGGPIARYSLVLDKPPGQMVVTEDSYWFFPWAVGKKPVRVERIPDMMLLQMVSDKRAGRETQPR